MHYFFRIFLLFLLSISILAKNNFVVKAIKIQGLVNVPVSTVYANFNINKGSAVNDKILKANVVRLYKSKFFKSIQFVRNANDELLLKVIERPMVAFVGFSGQKTLDKKMINEVLLKSKLQAGQPYSPKLVDQVIAALLHFSHDQGMHDITVKKEIEKLSGNRVRVLLKFNEGDKAKVKRIKFTGNIKVKDADLLDEMSLQPHFWSFISENNNYSAPLLEKDLLAIKNKYLDLGYINIKVKRKKVDFKDGEVSLVIEIKEGYQYKLSQIGFFKKTKYQEEMRGFLDHLQPGDVFSRKEIMVAIDNITEFFKNKGYAYVQVRPSMKVNEAKNIVAVRFEVVPGSLVVVRHVNFFGNTSTNDRVLRREMLQNETELYSSDHIKESIRKINNLGYVRDANCHLEKIKGHVDQADLDCSVTESPAISASVSAGYGSQNGALFQLNFAHKSLLGTGYGFRFNATRMITAESIAASIYNPYFTDSGVSQNLSFNLENFSPARTVASTWSNRDFAFENRGLRLAADYGIPMSDFSKLIVGISGRTTKIRLGNDPSASYQDFIDSFGDDFKEITLHIGWRKDSLDRVIFPTSGGTISSNIEVGLPVSDFLKYYKIDVKANYYRPIANTSWIFKLRGGLGYGRGYGSRGSTLPFFKNYFAGGMDTVRGFAANSLGQLDSKNRAVGGAMLAHGSASIILPSWFGEDIRLAMFVDAGAIGNDRIRGGDMRYSSGVAVHWRTAIAPLVFSFATPLQRHAGDIREIFAFELGTVF